MKCSYSTITNFPFPLHEILQSFLILLELTKKHFPRSPDEIPCSFLTKLSLLRGYEIY